MAAEYQRWIKVANDLGLGGDELRTFVKDRQEEAEAERTKVEEAEKETRKLEAEREARKLETEREARKLETEREARKLEADTRKLEAEREAKKLEQEERKFLAELEVKRISEEQESLERIKLRELEIRLTIEQGNAERQNFIGQGDVRTEHRGTIRDV